jgi:hypothetical protein
VRVVAYFNPERFVAQRQGAELQLKQTQDFVAELNQALAESCRKEQSIVAQVDRHLRALQMLDVFDVQVHNEPALGRQRHCVQLTLKADVWERRRRYDGFSVLVATEDLPSTAAELCLLYRAKDAVEKDFQVIKGVTDLRPIWHRTPPKILAHVTLCMLALILERTRHLTLSGAYTAGNAMDELRSCHLNRYSAQAAGQPPIYSTTELTTPQRGILRKLHLLHLADDDHIAATITPQIVAL